MNPQPKPLPRVIDKEAKRRETDRQLRGVYKLVDERDGHKCCCCGVKTNLEHHHRKSRGAGGAHTTANILLLCATCHRLAQQYRIEIIGVTCDGWIAFAMTEAIAQIVFTARRLAIPTQVRIVG
jgi:hypothetical protein